MGVTLAYFHSLTKIPEESERLKINVRERATESAATLRIFAGILSKPVAFEAFRDFRVKVTFWTEILSKLNSS